MKKKLMPTVLYAQALGHAPGDKRVEILRLIGQSGSISQAARAAGVSYKAAWQAVDTLTNLAGVVLVERAVGGAGGGGASLSGAGLHLLAAADALAHARRQVLDRLQSRLQPGAGGMPSFSQLSVRTSMRNQLPCLVQALEVKGPIVRVTLALSSGAVDAAMADAPAGVLIQARLVSRITRESAELLALQPGQAVLALCKATAVTVQRLPGKAVTGPVAAPGATGSVLAGRAIRVSRGEAGDEVSLRLDAGLQLVGFAAPASGIRVGARVMAQLDEAALVVALPG